MGASENTFKHLQDRHPYHYHPGFKLVDSDRQEIANPEVKQKEKEIASLRRELSSIYRKLAKTKQTFNKDGTPRGNSARERLEKRQKEVEQALAQALEAKKGLPERVDVSGLQDYRAFNRVDDEGKYLFDFATTSVWNARKKMVEWLKAAHEETEESVDLFYAIIGCHGWIRSTEDEVVVRLEPVQQPRRRAAQEQLCRKLSAMLACTPSGRWMRIEVGDAPDLS